MAISLKKQVFSSMKWNTLAVIVNVLVQVLRISVLARFLDRDDFGMIAIALMVVSFTEIFADLGFTVPLIHKQNISNNEYSSVFWVNNLLAVVIFAILYFSAPLIARIYETPQLVSVIQSLGITIILNALGKIFQTIKQKELEYKFISLVSIISNLVGFALMIVFAIMGCKIWSLVWGTIIMTTLRQGVYFLTGLRNSPVRFHCSLQEISDFIRIGTYQVGAQILDFIASKIDIIILGKTVGMDNLGTYNLAKELIIKCYALSNSLTKGVMSAAFAKIQNDIQTLKATYLKFCNINSWVFVPLFAIVFLFADDISMIMYGNKWHSIYQVLAILAIYGAFSVITGPIASILISLGRTDLSLWWTLVQSIVSAVGIIIAGHFGFMPVVYAQVPISVILFIFSWFLIIKKILPISLLEYSKNTGLPIFDCFVIALILTIIQSWLSDSPAADFFMGAVFILCYIIILNYRIPQLKASIMSLINKKNI